MKKLYSLLAIAVIVFSANAQTELLRHDFNYTGILTNNGWVKHSGATIEELKSNGTAVEMKNGLSEDVNIALPEAFTIKPGYISKLDYSIKLNILDATKLKAAGDYFVSFGGTAGATLTILPARLYYKPDADGTGYYLGVLNTSGGTATPTYSETKLSYSTEIDVTVEFTVKSGVTTEQTVTLSINGVKDVSNNTGTGSAPAEIASVALRKGGTATNLETPNLTIDDLVVRTYPDVLSVSDIKKGKASLVKNSLVADQLMFASKGDIQIINANGQVVKTAKVEDGTSLNVSSLSSGMYIVTGVVDGENVSQKIIKK